MITDVAHVLPSDSQIVFRYSDCMQRAIVSNGLTRFDGEALAEFHLFLESTDFVSAKHVDLLFRCQFVVKRVVLFAKIVMRLRLSMCIICCK